MQGGYGVDSILGANSILEEKNWLFFKLDKNPNSPRGSRKMALLSLTFSSLENGDLSLFHFR